MGGMEGGKFNFHPYFNSLQLETKNGEKVYGHIA